MVARWFGDNSERARLLGNWVETQTDYNALPVRPLPPAPWPPGSPPPYEYYQAVERSQIQPPLIWETQMPLTWAMVFQALGHGFSTNLLGFIGERRTVAARLASELFYVASDFEQLGGRPVSTAESSEHIAWRSSIAAAETQLAAIVAALPDAIVNPNASLPVRIAALLETDLSDAQRLSLLKLQLVVSAPEPPFHVADFYRKPRTQDLVLNAKTFAEWSTAFKNALLALKAFLGP